MGNTVTIQYLYLDLNTCDRCTGTDKVLEEVLCVLRWSWPVIRLSTKRQK